MDFTTTLFLKKNVNKTHNDFEEKDYNNINRDDFGSDYFFMASTFHIWLACLKVASLDDTQYG